MLAILWIIYIACLIVWLFPPFRQYRSKYFYYFLALALADPAKILLREIFNIDLWVGHVISTSLYIVLLMGRELLKKLWPVLIIIVLFLAFIITKVNDETLHNIVAFNLIIVLFIVAKDLILDIKETEAINVFYIVLLLYVISGIMKVLFRVSHSGTGHLYFFLTNFFQIFIAIYFTIYNVNNAKKFRLFKDEQII